MKKILIFTAALLLSVASLETAKAQKVYKGEWTTSPAKVTNDNNGLTLEMTIDISGMKLKKQQTVTLTPVIRSKDNTQTRTFAPIIVVGKQRDRVIRRSIALNNFAFSPNPDQYLLRLNRKTQIVPVKIQVPFEKWMRDADLYFVEDIAGCVNCDVTHNNNLVVSKIIPHEPFLPVYKLLYMTPEAEAVKQRSETHTARLTYKNARTELLRDYNDNARVLREADDIVREIRNDKNLKINNLIVSGYASPDGNYEKNMQLSKDRAFTFVSYLKTEHGIPNNLAKTTWYGEDWAGLRRLVAESSLYERDAILRVIDSNTDISKRKAALKRLSGGATYRMLLEDYYPQLRRNEYSISYVARSFNIEEAKAMINTKPQHLSLNEMFLVANSYEKGSDEFKNVFDIAVRLYPDNIVANLNAATQDIERGALQAAQQRLIKLNLPESWNNLAISYALNGDYQKALPLFKKAAEAGNETARYNLEQAQKFIDDQPNK